MNFYLEKLTGLEINPRNSDLELKIEDLGINKFSIIDEYVAGIDLESQATPFQARLMLYGDQPISTFSILA